MNLSRKWPVQLPRQKPARLKISRPTEPADVTKIVPAVDRCCASLSDIDPFRIAAKTINGLYDGAMAHAPSLIPGGCRLHHREERGGLLGWVISKLSGTNERPLVVSPRGLR